MEVEYSKEGRIAIFTINRPQALNAMSVQAWRELRDALAEFRDDEELLVGIITGTGDKAFCVGADIKDLVPFFRDNADTSWKLPWYEFVQGLSLWKPLIAAVNGMALGGGFEIALGCDLRIAAENASFGFPEAALGLIPGWGGTQRLPRTISQCQAAEMLFLGKPIDAQEAYRIGLINKIVPQKKLMTAAKEMAEAICQQGPLAVRAAKEAMKRGVNMPIEEGIKLELALISIMFKTEDFGEGTRAFLEKRKPQFKSK